ncbi:hypothetical protein HYS31_05550 [Candidatus Woesearchaeota archaeon]|nr:hypothetical protein [Candidatus Woesearchaeota archaeon]
MPTRTALDTFNQMDLRQYAGLAIGIVNGKIAFKNKDPNMVMKRLLAQGKEKEVALICVPKVKMAMSL